MGSWSELKWEELQRMWLIKMRYGGHPDVARVAALLSLQGCEVERLPHPAYHPETGERLYTLRRNDGELLTVTPRELSQMALKLLPWFDYPYGDPGEPAVTDDKGHEVKPPREPVRGYVSQMHDAMILPESLFTVHCSLSTKTFLLPSAACNNLTWQQYRALQNIAPNLFREGMSETEQTHLQAEFLAHCLTPRSLALLDTSGGSIRLRPHYEYRYNAEQAESLIGWWERRLSAAARRQNPMVIFHICLQVYQTALTYYAQVYPLLFSSSGKNDTMRDALQGEVGTINTVMKYAGYSDQQQVYDSNLPFVLDILNTMTKEAKEIERMNAKIKKH